MSSDRRLCGLALFFFVLVGIPATSPAIAEDSATTPADVYVRVAETRAEIELIRFEMGRPRHARPEIAVSGIAPREVFFQVLTLFEKANRLGFEQTRTRAERPLEPSTDPTPADVLRVVDAALSRLRAVKADLGIVSNVSVPPVDPSKRPVDVFKSIVQANRQLSLLLVRRFSPSDVYEQVTVAIGYAARLRSLFPGNRVPPAPAREAGKRPQDVYRLLIDCLNTVKLIAATSGLSIATLEASEEEIGAARPSDVYDISSLLVAELAFLHQQPGALDAPRPAYYPGRKFPSDVYQRAGQLKIQLDELQVLAKTRPDWLRPGTTGK